MATKVSMVSLGCSKNQIDGEIMLAALKKDGFTLVSADSQSDVVIVNTCGFIQSAKEEAIENILELATLKKEGTIKGIVVTGCLAERYQEEILETIPEVDAVLGIGSNDAISKAVRKAMQGEKMSAFGDKENLNINGERILTTLPYFAYLKIAEGCDNHCSYCAIPMIRGRFRSRTMESIVEEAKWLVKQGVKEIVLIAQDDTRYGEDLYGKYSLAALLNRLCEIEGLVWLRLLYCYPDKITDELLDVIASQPKVVNYIDMPIQHCNQEILREMNRPGDREWLLELIAKIRAKIPGVTLRTTLITGFPGETEQDFEELTAFVQEADFDHLGCFAYSAEEGTPAALMPDQVDDQVKEQRAQVIMDEQYTIAERKNQARIGTKMTVLVEGYDKYGECYFGRSEYDAPDIDGKVFFDSAEKHQMGDFVTVLVEEVCEYDLVGRTLGKAV